MTDQTGLDDMLLVLIINENEEQEDFKTEYVVYGQPDCERAGNQMDTHGVETKLRTMRELLEASANYWTCTRVVLTIGFPEYIFTFATEDSLVRISPADGMVQQYIPASLRQRILQFCHHSL